MNIVKTPLIDCTVIEPKIYEDDRGFFYESFHEKNYREIVGINHKFVQDNFSFSKKNVLRGLHFQKKNSQGKLVRVAQGEVFDVAVDLRKDSASFKHWFGINLSESNRKQLWIPPGFAHGFLVLSDYACFEYKCTNYYDPNDEFSLLWNDPEIGISWPTNNPLLSEKDANGNLFKDLEL